MGKNVLTKEELRELIKEITIDELNKIKNENLVQVNLNETDSIEDETETIEDDLLPDESDSVENIKDINKELLDKIDVLESQLLEYRKLAKSVVEKSILTDAEKQKIEEQIKK